MSDSTQPPGRRPPLLDNAPVRPSAAAQPGAAAAGPQRTSGLAIAGFVTSLLPIFCISVVGLGLSIAAYVQIGNRPNELKGKGFAIAGMIIGSVFTFIGVLGMLAAIAIPNFLMFQARAKQSEAKTNLKAIYTVEKMTIAETGQAATGFSQTEWRPEGTTRYTYYLGDEYIEASAGTGGELPDDVRSFVEGESFRAVAVGNIDGDETLDVWVIDHDNNLENLVNDVQE